MSKPAAKHKPPAAPRKSLAGAPADSARDITPAELRAMIQETALQGAKGRSNGLRTPDETALVELADIVNHWQRTYARARRDTRDAELIKRVQKLRDALIAEIPALTELTDSIDERNPLKAGQLERLRVLADSLTDFPLPKPPAYRTAHGGDNEKLDWHWIVRVLRADFARHLGDLGARDDGPAGRLLAAILARVCGERVSPATVAKFLRATNDKIT